MSVFGFGLSNVGSGGGVGVYPKYITNAGIITTITSGANWDGDGNYTGSTTGLVSGNVYVDIANKIRYEYNGTNLIREPINSII